MTTPTTAASTASELNLDRLEKMAKRGDYITKAEILNLIALARRGAQPVQAVPDALYRIAKRICERWDEQAPVSEVSEEHKELRAAIAFRPHPAPSEPDLLDIARAVGMDVVPPYINPERTVGGMTSAVLEFGKRVAGRSLPTHAGVEEARAYDMLLAAAQSVVNDALEEAEDRVHICDRNDNDRKAKAMPVPLAGLYYAVKAVQGRAALAESQQGSGNAD